MMQQNDSNLDIPYSDSIVTVRAISPNRVFDVPPQLFVEPYIEGSTYADTPCLSFLIEHQEDDGKLRRIIFDLGIRKDLDGLNPQIQKVLTESGIRVETAKDVIKQLSDDSIEPGDISAICFSHGHFDHVGDVSQFPNTVRLVVGPGLRESFVNENLGAEHLRISTERTGNCQVTELDFEDNSTLKIGRFAAVDYFQDGSFYLLSTPGHAIGHMSALARVTSNSKRSSFVFLAGDICHHMGELRPSRGVRLLAVNPTQASKGFSPQLCMCVHPTKSDTEPFYRPAKSPFNLDAEEMKRTIAKASVFDSSADIFLLLAHDNSLLRTIDLFPKCLNNWQAKGWKEAARWTFLEDFVLPDEVDSASTAPARVL